MNDTDLKPGDIVRHPMWGNGVVAYTKFGLRVIGTSDGYECIFGLTGWERVETARPGHVQVRVDDLDNAHTIASWAEWAGCDTVEEACKRIGQAFVAQQVGQAQRAESTPPADEKPTSATVELYCPDCGEAEKVTVVMLGKQSNGERWFDLREFHAHTCPPAQPDEPTEFGARIVVTRPDDARITAIHPDGSTEKWLRADRAARNPWVGEASSSECSWDELTQRGTVTIGWDE